MGRTTSPLATLAPGEEAVVVYVRGGHGVRNRLIAMGLNPGTSLRLLHSRGGGPILVQVGDARLALGRGLAQKIMVTVR